MGSQFGPRLLRSGASLLNSGSAAVQPLAPGCTISASGPALRTTMQVRHGWLSNILGGSKKKPEDKGGRQLDSSIRDLLLKNPKKDMVNQMPEQGGLSQASIFEQEADVTGAAAAKGKGPVVQQEASQEVQLERKQLDEIALAYKDPNREMWQWPRRHEFRQHKRRGRLTKEEVLLRTEKELTLKSHMFKTSMKKLAPLARLIAGMNIDQAMIQMKFSPKGAAKDVLGHLEEAKATAIVRQRMEPSEIYISEAWVGKGPYEKELSIRARGRRDILMKPYTNLTVRLKEHKTRERIYEEKVAKLERKPVWQHLPARPIIGQTQYYRW
ncbi:ribosomal protein L22 [Ascobolus immersus RN42]|uniref:Ribosomal protein L22 n=1 Tax=Ascobolus immersus RN42 TaxID=1160509 RepID=A0A3N4IQJ5_ASCIM|nr:ribosomal protein L22 [Ascobolus immersus RN42]